MSFLCFQFLIYLLLASVPDTEYYDILGVRPTATDAEIKRAYKKLSLKYHPDRNKSPKAAEMQQKVNRAYEILSNPDDRHFYDMYGKEGVSDTSDSGNAEEDTGFFGGIFDSFFGGGSGHVQQGRNRQKTNDARVELQVTLNQLYTGTQHKISYQRGVICNKCRGTGAESGETKICPKCKGQGHILVEQNIMPGFRVQTQQTCPRCKGRGRSFAKKCKICHGKGKHQQITKIEVEIEKGMSDGHEIRYPRKAEEEPGYITGDLIVVIKQLSHKYIERDGNNLKTAVEINLEQSLLGFDLNIEHLDENWINLKHNDITYHEMIRNYKGKGMPIHNYPSEFGDMFIEYRIKYPNEISDKQKQMLIELFPEQAKITGEYLDYFN